MGFEHDGECGPGCGHYEDDSNYCKHGTFTGSWAGPDYMCGWCEMGTTDEEYREEMRYRSLRASIQRRARLVIDAVVERRKDGTLSPADAEKHIIRVFRFI